VSQPDKVAGFILKAVTTLNANSQQLRHRRLFAENLSPRYWARLGAVCIGTPTSDEKGGVIE